MANREVLLTEKKVDLVALLYLVPDQAYLLQNTGDFTVQIGEFADEAAATERAAFKFFPGRFLSIPKIPEKGSIFVWSIGGDALIALDEAQ